MTSSKTKFGVKLTRQMLSVLMSMIMVVAFIPAAGLAFADEPTATPITGDTTITSNGSYSIADGKSAAITVAAGVTDVKFIGSSGVTISDDGEVSQTGINASIDASAATGVKITLQNIYLENTVASRNVINFAGTGNELDIEGTVVIDQIANGGSGKAGIHVPSTASLNVYGAGTLYFYKTAQGAGFGGNPSELNGTLNFGAKADGTATTSFQMFAKGTKQGALIGAGANSASASGSVGAVTFTAGEYNLITNSRAACVGGAAGANGASAGTTVTVKKDANININVDYSGAAIGGGGYDGGNDSTGGTLKVEGGSLRVYVDTNAANNTTGWMGRSFAAGVNDAPITAQRVASDGTTAVYRCPISTSGIAADSDGKYTVTVGNKTFYYGGKHQYYFVQEALDKGQQLSITSTPSNWKKMTGENADNNLYLYLPATTTQVSVNGTTFNTAFNSTTETFTVTAASVTTPTATISGNTEVGANVTMSVSAVGASAYQWYYSADNGSNWSVISGANEATYTTAATTINAGYVYKCAVTISGTTVNSNTVAMGLAFELTGSVTWPYSGTAAANALIVTSGAPDDATYSWRVSSDGGDNWNRISDATSSSLVVTNAANLVNYKYECSASYAGYTAKKIFTPTPGPTATVTGSYDQSASTITLTASCSGAQTYKWYVMTSDEAGWTKIDGATSSTYTVAYTSAMNDYKYKVLVYTGSVSVYSDPIIVSSIVSGAQSSANMMSSSSIEVKNATIEQTVNVNSSGKIKADLYTDGTLVIRQDTTKVTDGSTTNLSPSWSDGEQAWYSFRDKIKKVRWEGNIAVGILDYFFMNCKNLTEVENWPSKHYEYDGEDQFNLSYTFYGCTSLKSVPDLGAVTSATALYYTFCSCSSLETMPNMDGSTCTTDGMFSGCTSLTTIYKGFTFSGLKSTKNMFYVGASYSSTNLLTTYCDASDYATLSSAYDWASSNRKLAVKSDPAASDAIASAKTTIEDMATSATAAIDGLSMDATSKTTYKTKISTAKDTALKALEAESLSDAALHSAIQTFMTETYGALAAATQAASDASAASAIEEAKTAMQTAYTAAIAQAKKDASADAAKQVAEAKEALEAEYKQALQDYKDAQAKEITDAKAAAKAEFETSIEAAKAEVEAYANLSADEMKDFCLALDKANEDAAAEVDQCEGKDGVRYATRDFNKAVDAVKAEAKAKDAANKAAAEIAAKSVEGYSEVAGKAAAKATYKITSAKKLTVEYVATASKAKSVTVPATVKLSNGKTYKVTSIGAKAFGKKAKTVTIKTKNLTKKTVKKALKSSKVKTVKVKVGKKADNKKFVKKYKKIFTKKIAGKKVVVK